MLRIRNLDAGYGKLRVLKNVSLHVDPGEIVTMIGANGAGKTTLLHTIIGLLKSTQNTQQRRLARTIAANQAHTFSQIKRKIRTVQQRNMAKSQMRVK